MPSHKKDSLAKLQKLTKTLPRNKIVSNKPQIKEEKPEIIDKLKDQEREIKHVEFIEKESGIESRNIKINESNEKSDHMSKLSKRRRVRRSKRNPVTPESGIISN